jgi:hypothetical protein
MMPHVNSFPKTITNVTEADDNQWLQKLAHWLDVLECAIVRYFTKDHEPRISYRIDRNGQERWVITDPNSNQRIVCTSASEVRLWLDQLYEAY